jgi:fido (protein-threonine AMPylation protein)
MNDLLKVDEISATEPQFLALDNLKSEWSSVQPLSPEAELRLKRKLRLEWNYNSNHIEGNTLTYGETELLLIQGQTVGEHSIREYEEMKAHDVAVEYVGQLAKDNRPIGEADIRDLNKIILKEPFWKAAQTLDGKSTRKQIIPGEYKSQPNNVKTATGEIFEFASPEQTPKRMLELVTWLRAELETPTLHPLEVATKLHHDFVLIHPFDDGNGRVGRLLVNYVLDRAGFPPIIIKSADKTNYLAALRLADVGQVGALIDYFGKLLEWSLQLCLRAAKGEKLEEATDIEKEIAIFIREREVNRNDIKKRSPEVLRELYDSGWERLFSRFEDKISKLSPLFAETKVQVSPATSQNLTNWRGAFADFVAQRNEQPAFSININLRGYKSAADIPFNVAASIQLQFEEFRYSVNPSLPEPIRKLYSQPILSDEADEITNAILRATFDEIKARSPATKS